MLGFLKRRKKRKRVREENRAAKHEVKPFSYHPKIILAWAKGIEGNSDLLNYLYKSGYEELVMATHALRLKDEAREWLMKNGYPHLMAMINGAEGNKDALKWLKVNNFNQLYNMAIAIDGHDEGFRWLNINSTQDIFVLTRSIKKLKDKIEEEHNDVHLRSRE